MRPTSSRVLCHVVLPVVIGAAIYLLWRDRSLRVFAWLDAVELTASIEAVRALAPVPSSVPAWARFTAPDALWVYALTAAMGLVWSDRGARTAARRTLWQSTGLALGAGAELAQATGHVPGTFDIHDLVACVVAFAAAVWLTSPSRLGSIRPAQLETPPCHDT